ncbi:fibronectin type III domain-containing protein [Flaviramulus sp. BrNp1-15]|uniref:DUF5123 domain-containing protein n=1 Tax=Flaviramulus sp. BrNp1-15 TaxID=2916754 RepID=UPI001EE83CCD|nr:DUF5123 domain-containing protein [Flaviramulus sp. BrNp1-15]ULC59027.1 fibronectin type III domain-containing protein [Flaviramulus sp. BrNp1-15]
MKTKYISKILFALLLSFIVTSCGYNEDVLEELSVDREFAPVALTARVRNQTTVELNWTANENIQYYLVEFSADDPNFTNIFQTEQVNANQLPIQIRLEGETIYSIRVKAVSARGLNDSSWALTEAETSTEQIMLPPELGDIEALQATLRWEAGLNVTHFILQPGDIRYDITAQEKADGIAIITGLTSETDYMATLYNNTKIRGTADFTTGIDVGDNTLVLPTDDLLQMIADAAPGDILLLEQGDYTTQTGTVSLDKSITIQGLRVDFKPLLSINFELNDGATDVNLIDLDLNGMTSISDVVTYSGAGNYNSLLISGCNIHDFTRSFVRGPTTDAIIQSVTIENSIISNILTSGGDFIDFRNSDVFSINVNTSTFNNCAPGRDFFRVDAAGTSNGTGLTTNIVLDSCTLYACSNSSSRRIFYVRFDSNDVTSRNNLITDTDSEGYADRAGIDETPTFSNNNYFNASGFLDTGQYIFDNTNYTELDPGYVDADSGDFTITNQTLIDNAVGDPRWRP